MAKKKQKTETIDDKLIKGLSKKVNSSDSLDKMMEKDPSNPQNIYAFLWAQFGVRPEQVPEEAFKLYTPTYLRYENAKKKAENSQKLVDEVKKDYKYALDLASDNLFGLFEEIPPIKGEDEEYDEIEKAHSDYFNLSMVSKLGDENRKINEYVKLNRLSGKVEGIVREFYSDHRGAINGRIEQLREIFRGELVEKFRAGDEIDTDQMKAYIAANIDKIPEEERDSAYLAIGKKVK